MAKRKRRPAPPAAPQHQKWMTEQYDKLSEEEKEANWMKARDESHTLLDLMSVELTDEEKKRVHEDFLVELDWYKDFLNGDDEKSKWWFCHQIRQNMLSSLFNPRYKLNFVRELDRLIIEACNEDAVERALLANATIAFLYTTGSPVELWSICRTCFTRLHEQLGMPDDQSDDVKRAYETFKEYEAMNPEDDPFLQWVSDETKEKESPIPFDVDEDKLEKLSELAEAIERGGVPIQLMSPDQIQDIYQKSEMFILPFLAQNQEMYAEYSHTFQHRFGRFSREFLGELRVSDRWDTIKTSIAVAASNSKMSGDEKTRKWIPHLGVTLETLDEYDRGNHPVLRAIVVQEVHRFHEQQMKRMQQGGGAGRLNLPSGQPR